MVAFRNLYGMSLTILVLSFLRNPNPENFFPIAINVYFFICINSLYHETKESSGARIQSDKIIFSHKKQMIRIDGSHEQQSPPTNLAIPSSCSAQVVIPMQTMHVDEIEHNEKTNCKNGTCVVP